MVGQASARANGYCYVLALFARSTPTGIPARDGQKAHLAVHEDSSAAPGDEPRPSRTQRFASAGPTSLRTVAQLERLADGSRASSAKLARIWSGSARVAARSSVRRASQRGIAQLWDGVSEFSQRRFDASERGGQRGAERHELAAARSLCAASSSEQAWS